MDRNAVTAEGMQLIDKKAIFDFGIPSIVLMENAGRAIYEKTKDALSPSTSKKVIILCGKGNNGGDGLVAARYLANDGMDVAVYLLCEEKRLKKDPLINFNILRKMGVGISCLRGEIPDLAACGLVIDAIFGTGFKGRPDSFTCRVIDQINKSKNPVLSVDIPSGLDATTGVCQGPCIKAAWTVSFGLPKAGFYKADGPGFTGEVIIRDIGFPASLLADPAAFKNQ